MRQPNYDKSPFLAVTEAIHPCAVGWAETAAELRRAIGRGRLEKPILVVECYPGVDEAAVFQVLTAQLAPKLAIQAAEAYHSAEKIDQLVAPFLGDGKAILGRVSTLSLVHFFNAEPLWRFRRTIDELKGGLVLIVGCGASLIAWGHILVFADLARRTARERLQREDFANLGAKNGTSGADWKAKQAFFVDWRVADRWKRPLISRWDYVLDTNDPDEPKLADAGDVRAGLRAAVTRPFRLAPALNSVPWGKPPPRNDSGPDAGAGSPGLSFDCAPEENSLVLGLGDVRLEIPAMDLVLHQSRALLGESVHWRFAEVFPIRFNLLDTTDVGDDWFQVHPHPHYLREFFGLNHSQDEHCYWLAAEPGARLQLGLPEDIDPAAMQRDLAIARTTGQPFPADKYLDQIPVAGHDHLLIPAGTVHGASGHSLVLQIAATPCIFGFELWDWDKFGRKVKGHPIDPAAGAAGVPANRETRRARVNPANRIERIAHGPGWREERLGSPECNFIETRRHWFTGKVGHDTHGGVNVLTLIAGDEAVVESPTEAFAPLLIHYAETFIVPAGVGEYTLRPHGPAAARECATLKAFVRAGPGESST